jgi:hypothetical protein
VRPFALLPLNPLVLVLGSPVDSTPPELVESMELLDLISDPQSTAGFEDGYARLVARHREPDDSAEDLAVKILLHAPEVAWRKFDRQALQTRRSLVSFMVRPDLRFLKPDAGRIERFRRFLVP